MGGPAAATEWVEVNPGTVVVATEARAWLHQPLPDGDPYMAPMTAPGTVESTRRLLDGALAAAEQVAARTRGPTVPMTALRYAWRVVGFYHLTRATPRIMRRAVERFEERDRSELAAFAAENLEEELGHDELALADLEALGYRADELVAAVVPPAAAALVARQEEAVEGDDPLDAFGFGYAIERSSTRIGASYLTALEEVLGPEVDATRCLRVHSALGADVAHVESKVRFYSGLDAAERVRIARAVYQAALVIYRDQPNQEPPEDELAFVLGAYHGGGDRNESPASGTTDRGANAGEANTRSPRDGVTTMSLTRRRKEAP